MNVQTFVTSLMDANCYVLWSGKEAFIVDPAGAGEKVLRFLEERELKVVAIINTHGHGDHIAANEFFRRKTAAPLLIHNADKEYLSDDRLNLASFVGRKLRFQEADRLVEDGDTISLNGEELMVIHTPGHTPGSICLFGTGFLLSGDTLFKGSVGRTDLPGGSGKKLEKSLVTIARLPLDTVIYPGHGERTTLKDEIADNPYL